MVRLMLGEPRADRLPLARRAAVLLGATTAVLLAASPLTRWWARYQRQSDADYGDDLPLLFDVNTEATIPTWYSAALLLAVAGACALLTALSRVTPAGGTRWLVLAAVFAAMALDESVALHERLGEAVANDLGVADTGLLRHPWVVAGAVLAVGLLAVVAWAVATLPRLLRRGVLAGLGLYVTGGLVLEAISGAVLDARGDGIPYAVVTLAEEGAEMLGAIAVLCVLLAAVDVRRGGDGLRVRLASSVVVRPREPQLSDPAQLPDPAQLSEPQLSEPAQPSPPVPTTR